MPSISTEHLASIPDTVFSLSNIESAPCSHLPRSTSDNLERRIRASRLKPLGRQRVRREFRTRLGHEDAQVSSGPSNSAFHRALPDAEGSRDFFVRFVQD